MRVDAWLFKKSELGVWWNGDRNDAFAISKIHLRKLKLNVVLHCIGLTPYGTRTEK